jgi:hypothetical protein
MLKRALIKNKNRISGWLAGIGAVLGILLICVSLQFYTDVKALLDINKEFYTSDFIPVHKKLGGSMLFSYGASAFTQEEMDEMRRQPYSKAVGPIEQGLFKVSGSVSLGPGMPGMATELFFESLDDRFIDIDKKKWKWSAGDLEVPVILPAPYLEMYNFGMAPSQKLPALTEKTLGKFVFNLEISGNNNAARMRGRIVGFSKRINAILVPKSFLAWANGVFGHNKTASVVHLIWEVEDMADPRIGTFLSERGYETSMDILGASRAKSILNVVITVCLLLGSIMVFLAALVFVQYNQLLISRKEYNVKVLFMMGYTRKKLLLPRSIPRFGTCASMPL